MLPPVDSTVLQNNPDFAILYKTLTTVILNPNGSTKADPKAKQREAVKQVLAPILFLVHIRANCQ